MKNKLIVIFLTFLLFCTGFSQESNFFGKVVYVEGRANIQRKAQIHQVKVGVEFLRGDKLRLQGSLLMMGSNGNMAWLTEGVYVDTNMTFSLISPPFVKYSEEFIEFLGLKTEFSKESYRYVHPLSNPCKTPMDTVDGVFGTDTEDLPIEPYLVKSFRQYGGVGKIFRPKVYVHVSSDAVNPRVEVYNISHDSMLVVPLEPGYKGEVDLSSLNMSDKDRFLDFVFCDDTAKISYFSNSRVKHSMSLNNFDLYKQRPFDELLYALKLQEHGCKMEALCAIARAKDSLPKEQKVFAEIFLRKWFYCVPRAISK